MATAKPDQRKISEMRNLGPATQKDLNAAGMYTAEDLKQHGPEGAFVKMLVGRKQLGRSGRCCNAAYLYAIYGAIHGIDWRQLPEKKKAEFRAFSAELRDSGEFA